MFERFFSQLVVKTKKTFKMTKVDFQHKKSKD